MKTMKISLLTLVMSLALGVSAKAAETNLCNPEGDMDQCRSAIDQGQTVGAQPFTPENCPTCFKNTFRNTDPNPVGFNAKGTSSTAPATGSGVIDGGSSKKP